MIAIGLDEAGRGPVIGPMSIGGVLVRDTDNLPDGVEDSKQLTDNQREELYNNLIFNEGCSIGVEEITASEIDQSNSINSQTIEKFTSLAQSLIGIQGEYVDEEVYVFVDSCYENEDRTQSEVFKNFSKMDLPVEDISVVSMNKADEKIPIVSAASIVAKEQRERHIELLNNEVTIGSGYPSDPTTREWLKEYEGEDWPSFVRTSWSTIQDL